MLVQFGSYLIGIFVVLLVLKIISMPMKIIFRLIINSVIGLALIYLLAYFGLKLIIPWWGYVIIGITGIPGVIFMAIVSFVFL